MSESIILELSETFALEAEWEGAAFQFYVREVVHPAQAVEDEPEYEWQDVTATLSELMEFTELVVQRSGYRTAGSYLDEVAKLLRAKPHGAAFGVLQPLAAVLRAAGRDVHPDYDQAL